MRTSSIRCAVHTSIVDPLPHQITAVYEAMLRELAYRLYTLCERKKRAAEALSYNGLVQSWPEIVRLAKESPKTSMVEGTLPGFD